MWRQSRCVCFVLFITLAMSGWGGVLAAAFSCPHAGGSTPVEPAAAMAADHACCRARRAAPPPVEHCASPSQDEAMGSMQMPAAEDSLASSELIETLLQTAPPCEHCLSRSAPVPAPVNAREQNGAGREASILAHGARHTFIHLEAFKPPVLQRQGAPPGTSTPRHILNSIFLI